MEKWESWCEQYKTSVQDYNIGTLLRLKADENYTENNACFVLRVQFLAIEIARNKERKNENIFKKTKAEMMKPKQGGGCCHRC